MRSKNPFVNSYNQTVKSLSKMSPLEKAVTIVGSIEPLTMIPQVMRLYELKSAEEMALFSWSFWFFGSCLWLFYGISIKSWPLIISSILWILSYAPIIAAILLYG